jgi:hypothetical protein
VLRGCSKGRPARPVEFGHAAATSASNRDRQY